MRYAVILAVLLLACLLPASASDPGEPLDCTDFVFEIPGFSCSVFLSFGLPEDHQLYGKGTNLVVDNEGWIIRVTEAPGLIELLRFDGVNEQRIGYVDTWRAGPEWSDWMRLRDHRDTSFPDARMHGMYFDASNGRLYLPLASGCQSGNCPCGYSCYGNGYGGRWIAAIEGFTTTFEILQTYTPTPGPISFRVPYMPEGFQYADYFDTYWGDLGTVGDWSQAQPLQCGYPAAPPSTGDYLTVEDALPPLQPGQGRYYVTAVHHQGETRYGRKSSGGVLTWRDPALLPGCGEKR